MKKALLSLAMVAAMAVFCAPAFATNGDNIIGVGPISRSMGGVGAAAPQDAITAVFGNPAAMCYIPCETSEADFAGTVFDPSIRARVGVTVPTEVGFTKINTQATSHGAPYAFPAIGIYTPISDKWRFGLAAYGISGLGVDYKDTDLRGAFGFPVSGAGPGDVFTQYQLMKFAPNIAYMVLPNFSVGAALQINYAQLDLGDGSAHNFGVGGQFGINWKPLDGMSVGVTYQTAQKQTFKRVANLDGIGDRDRLALQQPQQVVVGLAYEIIPKQLLVEVNEKWLNWSDATGYDDFDWQDQYVTAVGMQWRPMDWAALRLGYNYGRNPVKLHNGFNPNPPGFGGSFRDVQGSQVPTANYEYLRIIGFPAVVTNHITAGAGINLTKKVSLNVGYMHAFNNTITEYSNGGALKFQSKLFEDSYEFGVNFMF